MTIYDIKQLSIRAFLAKQGITPKYERSGYGMYLSPLRNESIPSFKVDYNKNVWFDHGIGEGGSIIELVIRMERCSVAEAIRLLENSAPLCFHHEEPRPAASPLRITDVRPLTDPRLLEYLIEERGINSAIAREYCREVHYSVRSRDYFAVGFKNDTGGWELRNRNFKGSSTPKNITTIRNGSDTVMVFEGFIDFLSYLSLKGNPSPRIDTTVLNSVANLDRAIPFLEIHRTVHAFLDNDEAGRKALDSLRASLPSEVVDQSVFYREHKDLNDYWQEKSNPKNQVMETKTAVHIKRQTPVKKQNRGPKL